MIVAHAWPVPAALLVATALSAGAQPKAPAPVSADVSVAAPAASAVAGVPDTMAQRMLACASCHGDQGQGLLGNEYYPRLAGKPVQYLYNQLINFRDKRRHYAVMNYLVAYLGDNFLYDIADHYSKLQPSYPAPTKRAGAAELALGQKLALDGDPARNLPSCASCHGQALTGVEPAVPGLVGLYPPYVASQMGAWKGNKRHAMAPDCMKEVAQKLSPADISAVTAWLVAQPVPVDPRPAAAGSASMPLRCGGLEPIKK